MTVAELIEELRKYPPDTPVVAHHEGDTFWDTSPTHRLMDCDKDGQYDFSHNCIDELLPLKEGHKRMGVVLFW